MKKNNYPQRLQKVIANSGLCSRRKAEWYITAGKVKVNGRIITTLGTKVEATDIISVDNRVLNFNDFIYLAFYKPINCLTTLKDPQQRTTIMNYFSDIKVRIYPVGRLDFDTSGLLLMTNDGEFSNQVLHPRYKIAKVYQVICQGILTAWQIKQLETGVKISKTITTASAKVKVLHKDHQAMITQIELTIHQGYKNQIKRMLLAVGSKVIKLKRTAVGNITLVNLKPGTYRHLTEKEKNDLIRLGAKEK